MKNKSYVVQVKKLVGDHWEDAREWRVLSEARKSVIEEHARFPFLKFRIIMRWVEERELEVFKGVKNV